MPIFMLLFYDIQQLHTHKHTLANLFDRVRLACTTVNTLASLAAWLVAQLVDSFSWSVSWLG